MALQHLRSGTAHKRPIPTVMSAGQLAINTNEASPGLFFKDSNGDLVKVGPVHIGTTAPNSSPDSVAATALVTGTVYQILTVGTSDFTLVGASANTVGTIFTATGTTTGTGTVSGQQGVEKGEQWLDTTGGNYVLKIYDGTAWRSEAGEFVNVSGDTMTGDLVMNNANIVFEGATADDFETTLTVTDPTADRTITLPNVTGTVVTTGDTGSVTSTMIADGTIVNADVNASAAIAGTKINPDFGSQTIETTGVFSAATGAAATPSITFTGDANTGIYSPGADQFGVATGGSAALTIDSSQNVGIGKSSGGNKLEIEGQGDTKVVIDARTDAANGSDAILELWSKNSSGTNNYGFIDYDGDGNFEIGSGGSGAGSVPLVFKTNAQERLRIDNSGRLLVGTSSPVTTGVGVPVQIAQSNAGSIIALARNDTSTVSGNTLGRIEFFGNDSDGTYQSCAFMAAEADLDHATGDKPTRLVFSTTADGASSPTERMRIDSSGNLLIGRTSVGATGNGHSIRGGDSAIFSRNATGETVQICRNNSTGDLLQFRRNNVVCGEVVNTGATSVNYNTSSDYRLKENIAALSGGIDRVKGLKPSRFNFIAEPDRTVDGFLAHEAQTVVPECATGVKDWVDEDGNPVMQGIDQSKLVPLLTAALQEAIAKIETLEQRLSDAGIA